MDGSMYAYTSVLVFWMDAQIYTHACVCVHITEVSNLFGGDQSWQMMLSLSVTEVDSSSTRTTAAIGCLRSTVVCTVSAWGSTTENVKALSYSSGFHIPELWLDHIRPWNVHAYHFGTIYSILSPVQKSPNPEIPGLQRRPTQTIPCRIGLSLFRWFWW